MRAPSGFVGGAILNTAPLLGRRESSAERNSEADGGQLAGLRASQQNDLASAAAATNSRSQLAGLRASQQNDPFDG